MFSEDVEVLSTYVEESTERLDELEDSLRVLDAHRERTDPELVNAMFRTAHSLKAGANLLELRTIERLAHRMENILEQYRRRQRTPDDTTLKLLFETVDAIQTLLLDVEQSNNADLSSLLRRLATCLY